MKSDCDTCLRMCSNPVPSDWYSRADVDAHYCRLQIIWMIRMADFLDFGIWPDQKTGYIFNKDVIIKFKLDLKKLFPNEGHAKLPVAVNTTSPHTATIETWSEVYIRLQMTGRDGLSLWTEAKKIGDYKEFSQPAKDALNYMSGYRRRRLSYSKWLYERAGRNTKKIVLKK